MRLPRPRPSTLFYVALAVLASAPAWIVRYPPLQDMPFHVAALRVVHSFHDPHLAIDRYFDLTFGRTQYFFYYLLGSLIAYVTGVTAANVVLVCVYLGGTPLAIRSLCQAIGKDERLCILSVPLLVNVMFMFGLLPFMFGIPIMFWALAAAVRYFDELENARRPEVLKREVIVLAVLAFVLFFSHVFPFVLFGLGFAAIFPWNRPRDWIRAGGPTVPALGAVRVVVLLHAVGKMPQGAVNSKDAVAPLDKAFSGVFDWATNIFRDTTDEAWFAAFLFVALLSMGLSQGDRSSARREARLLIVIPLACFILYFTTGESRGPVWLFAQRFPTLLLLTLVPMLRFPRGMRGWVVTAAALFVAVGSTVNVCQHFLKFQLDEVGDIDDAIAQIPPGKKVAGLIYDKFSTVINWAPFLHFVSYYQAQRGGAVEFTYAGYTHWPFDFKPGMYPPQANLPPGPARPRWEWTPEQVSVERELMPWYDYVLERGNGFHPPPGTFHQVWHGDRWSVWKHD